MPNQIFQFDKTAGELVDVTPEKDRIIVEQLQQDAREIRRLLKPTGVQRSATYPYESEAMAVDPEEIPRAMAIARAHGVATNYNPNTGCAIIESPGHRTRHMRAVGFYERNSYTDCPVNR